MIKVGGWDRPRTKFPLIYFVGSMLHHYMVVSFSFRFVCLFFCPKNVRPFLSKIGGWDLVCGLFSQIQAQLRCYGRWKTTFGGESTPQQVRLRFGMLTVLTNIRSTKVLW